MSGKRDRTNELKVFLSDNEQYVLDEKVKNKHDPRADYENRKLLRRGSKEIKELMDKIWHTHESMLSKVPLQKL